jgi:hypothetical protein
MRCNHYALFNIEIILGVPNKHTFFFADLN